MKHLITRIDTFIKDRKLSVSFYIDNEWDFPFSNTSIDKLFKNVKPLSILELDFLEGCYLESTSFYKLGEKMHDGKIAYAKDKFPKTWKIVFDGTLEELKERNMSKLLSFQTIYSVEVIEKNNKLPYVKIITTENKSYPMRFDLFKSTVGINKEEFYLLRGVLISPVMFKKGDWLGHYDVRKDNKIVKSLNVRIEGTLDDHYKLYGNSTMKTQHNNWPPSYEKYNGYNDYERPQSYEDWLRDEFGEDAETAYWNLD